MIGGMMRCDICKNPVAPEFAEICSCGRDVCINCSNYQDSGEFKCCNLCNKKQQKTAVLTGEMLWEAFTEMFPPHSTALWNHAPKDTQEKYNEAAEKLNRQLGISK